MTRLSTILAALALIGITSVPAFAQTANKTWVSSTSGNDTGTCQFVSPCKTFAYAITQTVAGGELDVKDAGSYGVVTINKAISIVADGVLAAIAVPSGASGVTISAGSNDTVVLQGLVIDGHGVGQNGILSVTGGNITVVDCHIRNFTGDGISDRNSGIQYYHVANTEVANAKGVGIYVSYSSDSLNNVDLHNNGTGITAQFVNAMLTNSTVTENGTGILSNDGDIIVGNTTITNNTTYGINMTNNGIVGTYADNDINANTTDINGTLTNVARR